MDSIQRSLLNLGSRTSDI